MVPSTAENQASGANPVATRFPSFDVEKEFALGVHPDADARYVPAFRHAGQELARNLRQEPAGQDVVDVARARLDLLAAPGDRIYQGVVVVESGLVVGAHAVADAPELEVDDLSQHRV